MKICAVADLHGHLPAIPKCDVLLIAGDICPDFRNREDGQRKWYIEKFRDWLADQPVTRTLATWGNHDWLMFTSDVMKVDHCCSVDGVKFYFSPWCNPIGAWNWMKKPAELSKVYEQIPEGTDIVVSHQPPYGYGDVPDPKYFIGRGIEHVGSKELLDMIGRVRPKHLFCGHIHGGRGDYEMNDTTTVHNVSLVNEAYQPVHPIYELEYP